MNAAANRRSTPRAVALCLAISIGLLAGSAPEARAADEEHFTALDVFELEWASNPRVSPDGKTIAYSRNGNDVMTDRRTSRIWLVDADGNNHRPLVSEPGSRPVWSPDGDRLAFLARGDHGVEIYMHWLADNRTAVLTRLPKQPAALAFSPDGEQLAFRMFKPAPAKPMASGPAKPEGAKWAPAFKVYEATNYRADGQGYLDPGFNHIYVIPADGGSPRQVTSGDFHHFAFSWAADGASLVVSANRSPDWEREPLNSDLFQVDLDSGEIIQLTDRYGPDNSPTISPDGRYLAWTGWDDAYRGYENALLYVRDLVSGETEVLTADLDRSVSNPTWSSDSRSIYVQYENSGSETLARVDRNGRIRTLVTDLGG
ncbi:MAG: DPP IV N-terminal domain-containing protein, partial [Pseudomonadota bacterium]